MSTEIRGNLASSLETMTLVPEIVIPTSIPTLDRFITGLHSSQIILIDSADRTVFDLTHIFCVNAVNTLHEEVVWIDGGNSINPYEIGRICRRFGIDRNEILGNINIARAFTAYQLVSLVD